MVTLLKFPYEVVDTALTCESTVFSYHFAEFGSLLRVRCRNPYRKTSNLGCHFPASVSSL